MFTVPEDPGLPLGFPPGKGLSAPFPPPPVPPCGTAGALDGAPLPPPPPPLYATGDPVILIAKPSPPSPPQAPA